MAVLTFRQKLKRAISRFRHGNFSFTVNACLKTLPTSLRRSLFQGDNYFCPVCESHLRAFLALGDDPIPNILCPVCGSHGRHRLVMCFFQNELGSVSKRQRMLHLAPEPQIATYLQSLPQLDYLSADLDSPFAMEHFDITDIPYPDDTFDIIYCSHVLEHIPEDRQAMRELRRVLKPTGWALILVPITSGSTIEDPSITDPLERIRLFGQYDHVRKYGADFQDRLREAGFQVTVIPPESIPSDKSIANWDEFGPGEINLCRA